MIPPAGDIGATQAIRADLPRATFRLWDSSTRGRSRHGRCSQITVDLRGRRSYVSRTPNRSDRTIGHPAGRRFPVVSEVSSTSPERYRARLPRLPTGISTRCGRWSGRSPGTWSGGTMETWRCVAPSAGAWSMPGGLSTAARIQNVVAGTFPTSRAKGTLKTGGLLEPTIALIRHIPDSRDSCDCLRCRPGRITAQEGNQFCPGVRIVGHWNGRAEHA